MTQVLRYLGIAREFEAHADEATPSDGSGIIDVTLTNIPILPGTIIIETPVPAQEAHDDGNGNIVEDAASGIVGTINYATGKLYCTGAAVSTAYTTTYDEHTFGTKIAPKFFVDQSSAGLDVPDSPEIIKPGGLTRFKRKHAPGMYVPVGPVEFVADPPLLWYWIWLLLGSKATTDNTSTIADEATPSDGDGIISATLANTPIVPGTVIIETDVPATEAIDDGFGNIIEQAASGITGTINYATGALECVGTTASHAYTTTYDEGTFEHILTASNNLEALSATLKLGKDVFMHTFTGCGFSQLTLTVEKEFATVSIDVSAQKDEGEPILTLANVTIPQGYPTPFHKVTVKKANHGSAVATSADVESLTLTINMNISGEDGVTIGSRHPRRNWGGEVEIMLDATLVFEDTTELENFWGGASSPSADGTSEQVYQLILDGGVLGDVTIDLHKDIINTLAIQPSGRDRVSQEITAEALYDETATEIITVTCNSVYNYS